MTVGRLSTAAGERLPANTTTINDSRVSDGVAPGATAGVGVTVDVPGSLSIPADEPTRFEGPLTVSTGNAGTANADASVLVVDASVEGVRLQSASRSIDGVHLDGTVIEATDPDPPDRVEAAYRLSVLGDGTVTVAIDSVTAGARPVRLDDGEWVPADSSEVGGTTFIEVPTGTHTIAFVDESGSGATEPDDGGSGSEGSTGSDGDAEGADVGGGGGSDGGVPTAAPGSTPSDSTAEPTEPPRADAPDTSADSGTVVREPAGLDPVAVGGLVAFIVVALAVAFLRRRGA